MVERAGRYRLDGVIGVGSFATVHRALDERLADVVAIKVLAENHSLNPEVRERFIAEGRSIRRVTSPHVVTVHDIGESDRQQPYLVLEHADRGTLAARVAALRSHGWTASRADVLVTARSLAAAIEAVHRADLIHRDLSPGNVLLTSAPAVLVGADPVHGGVGLADVVAPGERLLVADLGMCKDLALNSGLTVAGGTSGFRPPEQNGPGVVGTRADLWALSTLVLWMCDGASPAVLPGQLFAALHRSTAVDPDDRHPDVAAWLADVEAALAPSEPPTPTEAMSAAATVTATSSPTGTPARLPGQPPRRQGRRTVAGLVVLALALAGGLLGGVRVAGGLGAPTSSGDAVIAIEGPTEITVGEPASFTAATEGVASWVWTLPTGAHLLDDPRISVTARSPGSARVVLRARASDGTDLEAVQHVTVTE